jgi:hypothetical protein
MKSHVYAMKKSIKLTLDIVLGAVAPVVILKYGTAPLGTLPAYLIAALVPVAWVLIDLLLITRHFNFISSYSGFSAIMRGALAFWYVSGWLFALKDTASYAVAVLVFGGSAFLPKPVTRSIAFQGLGPDTPARERALDRMLDQPTVQATLRNAALIIGATNGLAGIANYLLNYKIVTAPFNTPAFNDQVANVNAITRVALALPDMLALFWAFSMMYKAMYKPPDDGTAATAGDFWELLDLRDSMMATAATDDPAVASKRTPESVVALQSRANKQARGEFGV